MAKKSVCQEPFSYGSAEFPSTVASGCKQMPDASINEPHNKKVPATGPFSKLLALARSSDFAFASEELEADFQAYQAQALSLLSWFCALITTTGYCVLFAKIAAASADHRALLPHMLPPLLFQFAPTVATLALLAFFPGFYTTHKQAVHLVDQCCVLLGFHSTRQIVLWMHMVKGSNPSGAFIQSVQSFSDENLYLSIVWYAVPAFPLGQAGDIFIVLALLLANLRGNHVICASPLWHPDAVSLSAGLATAVQQMSAWLLEAAGPLYSLQADTTLSCAANIGFWQIVGSWVGCLAVCIAEVLRRRAFLRTPAAQARLGRQFAAAGLRWPFGSVQLASKCMHRVFLLTVGHCIVWAVVLDVFSH
eukprot:jgi/Botrbrau1/13480/Bobra.0082s0076.1